MPRKKTPSLPMVMAASASAPASPSSVAAPAVAPAPVMPATATQSQPAAQPPQTALITTTANGSNHGTKVDLQAIYQAVIAGLLEFYSATDVFQMSTGTYTRDELIAEFNQFVAAAQATKDSNAQWRSDIQTERQLEQHVKVLRQGIKGIVAARFGASGAQLLKFGYTLPKPRKKSAQTKAAAVAKGLATREKRQTLGKVQKKDIKGNVSVNLVVTPSNGGAQSATPTNPVAPPTQSASAPPAQVPVVTAPAAAQNGASTVAQSSATPAPVVVPPHPGTNGQ